MRSLTPISSLLTTALICVFALSLSACSSKQKTEEPEGDIIVKLRRVELPDASFETLNMKIVAFVDNQTNADVQVSMAKASLKIAGKARDDKRDGSGAEDVDEDPETVELEEDDGSLLDKEADTSGIVDGNMVSGKTSGVSVAAFENGEISIPVSMDLPTDPATFERLLSWGQIVVEVEGEVSVAGKTYAISGQREIAAPNMPKVVLRAAQVASENEGEQGAAFFDVGIENPNPFQISVDDFSFAIEVAGKELRPMKGEGDSVPASSVQGFEENVDMTVEAYGAKELRSLLRQNSVPYRLYGTMKFKGIEVPFEFTGEMAFPR